MFQKSNRYLLVCTLVACFVSFFVSAATAQIVVDPGIAEFSASSDHSAVDAGTPRVGSYLLSIYTVGGTQAVQSVSLGKPTPNAAGLIQVNFTSLIAALPTAVTYEARVSALGPGGSAASSLSNQFTFTAPPSCSPTISPASQSLTSAAGTGTVTVTAGTGCAWTAVSNATSWLSVVSGASRTGSGTVGFSATANTSASLRSGTITIAGHVFTVSQSGTSCSYSISPATQAVATGGGTGTVAVTTGSACAWTAVSSSSWITVSNGTNRTGNGSVSFTAAANASTASRSGTIIVAGKTFTVTQPGGTCSYVVSPGSVSLAASAASGSVTVTTGSGCTWSATSASSWLTVTAGTGRSGSGTLNFDASANSGAGRSGTLTVAGRTVTVSQDTAPTFSVAPSSMTIGANALNSTAAQQLIITQSAGSPVSWTITADNPWLEATPSSGSGTAAVSVSLKAGATLPAGGATATLTVTGAAGGSKTVTVTLSVVDTPSVPFGVVETPVDNTTGVTGSIAVTGWALDDIDIARIRVVRDPVAGEGSPIFIGNAVLVEGARPDVALAYPTIPHNTRGGWGLLVLTNMLPNLGNGTFTLRVYADDVDGHTTLLGSRTITCANSTSTTPFGAIDTPGQGETVSGTSYSNFGWVLTPGPGRADPPSGGRVQVVIDGTFAPTPPTGWASRTDLSSLFPASQYPGINQALGVYTFNTTTLANGVHTIAWVVTDHLGAAAGIGSRYFSVLNGSVTSGVSASDWTPDTVDGAQAVVIAGPVQAGEGARAADLAKVAAESAQDTGSMSVRRGFSPETPFRKVRAGADGFVIVQAEEMDRVELRLSEQGGTCAGYSTTGGTNASLPVGSNLDSAACVFTWQPGVGFVGSYDFVFVRQAPGGATVRQHVRIALNPRQSGRVGAQVVIDAPGAQQVVGKAFVVAGWAVDLDANTSGKATTGIDALHVWAYPVTGQAPLFLGAATYGGSRPDVSALYGNQFRTSGYGLDVKDLPAGTYDIAVFAWSSITGGFVPARTVRVTVTQ